MTPRKNLSYSCDLYNVPILLFYHFSIDATDDPSDVKLKYGRLINHGVKKAANAKVKVVDIDGTPHLFICARREIQVGEEILYDYGVSNLPWVGTLSRVLCGSTV